MSLLAETFASKIDPAQEIANDILDRPALIFAGQGAQEAGMGRELAEADKNAMDLWVQGEKISGLPLREIYWEGNEAEMNDTRALQPALTIVNYNLWDALSRNHNIQPAAAAGHSLGEYSALAASGVLSPISVLEITSLRGRLMAEADPDGIGTMAAIVKLSDQEVIGIVEEVAKETSSMIVAANFNTPTQTVVSGARNAVKMAMERAKEKKGRSIELKVSGAFHSPLMTEANKELAPLLERTEWRDPTFPVYCNVDAKPVTTGHAAKQSMLKQMITPVYWVNLIRNLYLAGVRWWMEISPRAVLGKMVGPSLAGIAGQCETLRVDLMHSLNQILQASF